MLFVYQTVIKRILWHMRDNDYDDDDGYGEKRRWVIPAVGVLAVLAIGFFVWHPRSSDDPNTPESAASSELSASSVASATSTPAAVTDSAPTNSDATTVSGALPATSDPVATDPSSAVIVASDAAAPTTTAATSTSAAPVAPAQAATYPTLPDGTPAPIIAVFNTDLITLSGQVPDDKAKVFVHNLALINSKNPNAIIDDSQLTINPTVPVGIGVRVVELTSARFDSASAVVQGAHAAELDRVVNVMKGLPQVTALVIGHADQRGSEAANQQISEQRAAAVVDYMKSQGIDGSRLSSRAVGSSDLITLNNDEQALALNRRTEFVLYGLLIGQT